MILLDLDVLFIFLFIYIGLIRPEEYNQWGKVVFMRRIFIGAIACLSILCLTSCRPSPTLEQVIHTQQAPEVDLECETKVTDNQPETSEKVEDLSPEEEVDESQTQRGQERDAPVLGEQESEKITSDVEYDKDSSLNIKTEQKKDDVPAQDESGAGNLMANVEATAGLSEDPNAKHIVDAYGRTVEIPKNVNRVSACGEAALLVQMLGGSERLVATSKSFTDNTIVSEIFGDENIAKVPALWTGSGASEISASKFQALIAAGPEVCFEFSGQETFTQEQVDMLHEKGIAYIVLPSFNTADNINLSVQIVGDVLGDKSSEGGLDAPAIAREYINFCRSIVNDVSQRVPRFAHNQVDYNNDKYKNGVKYLSGTYDSGKYSLFISEWDDSAYYKMYSENRITMEVKGVALARSGYSTNPLSYYMSLAGVVNTSAIYQDFNVESRWFVSPLAPTTRLLTYSGGVGTVQATNELLTKVGEIQLGSTDFPAIIVANHEIKEKLQADQMWKNYGKVTSKSGIISDYGFLDEDGNIVKTTIVGDYRIYVNPSGAASWTNGSVESIIEPIWVAWKFHNAYTEEEVRETVRTFYRKFYRYELSEEQIDRILNEK